MNGSVLIHIPQHTDCFKLTYFVSVRDRSAEHDDRYTIVELADGLEKQDPVALRQSQIETDKVDFVVGSDLCE